MPCASLPHRTLGAPGCAAGSVAAANGVPLEATFEIYWKHADHSNRSKGPEQFSTLGVLQCRNAAIRIAVESAPACPGGRQIAQKAVPSLVVIAFLHKDIQVFRQCWDLPSSSFEALVSQDPTKAFRTSAP